MPIGLQAIGIVRRVREQLRAETRTLTLAAERLPEQLIAAAAFKRNVGADRAWDASSAACPARRQCWTTTAMLACGACSDRSTR